MACELFIILVNWQSSRITVPVNHPLFEAGYFRAVEENI